MSSIEELRAACAEFKEVVHRLRTEVNKAIVGQQQVVDEVFTALFANGHVLLEGVPGLGKTLLVRTLGQALGLKFSRIQFTPDLMPADIVGTQIVVDDESSGHRVFQFRPGPIFTQILLADEVNRASPKSQSALLEAMQESSVTVGGETRRLERPFLVLATQNPIEHDGTYPLPEAQLDRFLLKVAVPYASRDEIGAIVSRTTGVATAQSEVVRAIAPDEIIAAQQLARRVLIAPHVQDYAVRLVLATHPTAQALEWVRRMVVVGASPRGAQGLVGAAKVRALMGGRCAASTQDIAAVAPSVLRHRIARSFEAEAAGVTADAVIAEIIRATPKEAQP
ncbi:MAG: MoxR family ATPase [Phycisphaerales bacterium]|nr:MoxR family ATPase [Phycisphaerales bacterium]